MSVALLLSCGSADGPFSSAARAEDDWIEHRLGPLVLWAPPSWTVVASLIGSPSPDVHGVLTTFRSGGTAVLVVETLPELADLLDPLVRDTQRAEVSRGSLRASVGQVAETSFRYPSPVNVLQVQYVVTRGDRAYILLFQSRSEDSAKYAPVFRRVIERLRWA